MDRWSGAVGAAVPLALLALAVAPAPSLHAQEEVEALADACAEGLESRRAGCLEHALAVQGVQGGVGLAHAGGSDLPGSASTVGKRLGTSPRIVVHGRVGAARMGRAVVGHLAGPHGEHEGTLGAVEGGVTVGALQGFNPARTVGGVLSLDLRATAARLILPEGSVFDEGVWGWGVGARLGLLRESLTLPGISVSFDRRWAGDLGSGSAFDGTGRIEMDVTTTSVRGTVGKDLFGVGVLLGAGWDRYESEGHMTPDPIAISLDGDPAAPPASFDDFTSERTLLFGGLTWHFLVLDLAVEGGWASGFDEPAGREGAPYDPGEGRLFGSASFRFTY